MKAVITGGAGLLGITLATTLLESHGYTEVVLLDTAAPAPGLPPLPPRARLAAADVRDGAALAAAFAGAAAVFHAAAYGQSGAAQLRPALVEAVNVGGTRAVVNACVAARVPRLVVTSTYNVVFNGQFVDGGDERLPPWPAGHVDAYSRSKAAAEALALAADGAPLAGGGGGALRVCAVRPAAIYGAGEQRHLPRVVAAARAGLLLFRFGARGARQDWVHVQNLAEAHALAAAALSRGAGGACVAGGRAYFVSDGAPVNTFDFLGLLLARLGYAMPSRTLPLWAVYAAAAAAEAAHRVAGLPPLLTRAEVNKAGVHHWMAIDAARADLGYRPAPHPEWADEAAAWFRERGLAAAARRPARARRARLLLLLLAVAVAVAAAAARPARGRWLEDAPRLPGRA